MMLMVIIQSGRHSVTEEVTSPVLMLCVLSKGRSLTQCGHQPLVTLAVNTVG